MEGDVILASRKRRVLALYLDFILFMVLWAYLAYVVSSAGLPAWAGVAAFVLGKTATYRSCASPGMQMLSISKTGHVDALIYRRESGLTIVVGVVFVLEGTKALVRWTQLLVPEPFFGMLPNESVQIGADIATGILFVNIGYLFLKLERAGFWLAGLASLATLVSCAMSWSLWDETVAQMVPARRALQGLPVGEHEVEFIQAIMPEGIAAAALAVLASVLLSHPRFKAARNTLDSSPCELG